jgi:putative glutamine amidotransferase
VIERHLVTTRPVIGIPAAFTTAQWGFWHDHAHLVADTYIGAVWEAGGLAMIIPPLGGTEAATLDQLLRKVDAVLLVGGADLDPLEYGQPPHELLEETSRSSGERWSSMAPCWASAGACRP